MRRNMNIGGLFSMLLLLVMAVSSFMVILYQINIYQSVEKENETSNALHLPYAYLLQKLRTADTIDAVDNTLVLSENGSVVYIYLHDEKLTELTTTSGMEFDGSWGEKLFDMNSFETVINENTINISYKINGSEKNICYSFKGLQHE